MTTSARRALPIIPFILLLSACGGGGDSPPPVTLPAPPPPPATVDVAAAWRNYVTAPHSWTMRGQGSDARTHEMTIDMKPGATSKFPMTGSNGQTSVQSLWFSIDGANMVSAIGTLFFTPQTFIGIATDDGACLAARSAMAPLPGAATVGASGPMFVLEGYAGCSIGGQKLGTTRHTWSIEAEGSLNMFCITSDQQNDEGANIGKEVACFEAAANGTLGGRAKFTRTTPDGQRISGRNF